MKADPTFKDSWEDFHRTVLVPARAGDTQVTETRRAFYAGGWAFYSLVMGMLDSDAEPTPTDLAKMQRVHDEFVAFQKLMREGKA